MKLLPISSSLSKNKININTFNGNTIPYQHKVVEEDILSINTNKESWVNPMNLQANFVGTNIRRTSENSLEIISKFGHQTGIIRYNKDKLQPNINVEMGNFQPLIKLEDKELGITILMTRGAELSGDNLNISYKPLAKQTLNFGSNKLIISTGYKSELTKNTTNKYFSEEKYLTIPKSPYTNKLSQEYTLVGLAGGYGSRLKPISDLKETNKVTTQFPSNTKTLIETSILDLSAKLPDIKQADYIDDTDNNLSGTAGVIIKGLKNGQIPLDKPLVLMTGDTFNNIDIAKALYDYEQDDTIGIAMVVNKVDKENWVGTAPVYFYDFNKEVKALHPKIQPDTSSVDLENQKVDGDIYSGTNITIISPKILNILKDYADESGKADFVEFLGLMFNVLNEHFESLTSKYPNGLKSKDLSISDLTDEYGYPRDFQNSEGHSLQFKVIKANDITGNTPKWYDVGTIEDYIQAVKTIKSQTLAGLQNSFTNSVAKSVDNNGVIYYSDNAKEKLELFKKKYGINNLSGNIIVNATSSTKQAFPVINPVKTILSKIAPAIAPATIDMLYKKTNSENSETFIKNAVFDKNIKLQDLVSTYGLKDVLKWYCDKNGYFGAYEKFIDDYYKNTNSLDELLKYQPNWAPWKLAEKAWAIDYYRHNYSAEENKKAFDNYCECNREYPFIIGKMPEEIGEIDSFRTLVNIIKTRDIKQDYFNINNNICEIKRLKGGDLNDKFVYIISISGKKYILKCDRTNVEDMSSVDGRYLSNYEKRSIRKNKILSADSIFINACVNRYLELNGCKAVPHLYLYDHKTHSSLYEYIEDIDGDKYQNDLIDEEYIDLDEINRKYSELTKYGIYMNDSAIKNVLVDKNNTPKIIDLGHCSYICPFKPGIKKYNIELSNINGPDIRNIYSSFFIK